ncbi:MULTISPECIES: hypothetical protein [Bizionia]|uniref:Uncharacterized protein n=1 Tax=Bizionia algoritergicola TaxID=291187 RepID=A0A5D0R3P5_9FLAO|nr:MULTISPECIES: hypothetical protein [Bizionia]OBX23747.1 hypothetical protein BAA08_03585 [Bizionia sp. APA-3]TYB75471.1 hypothetical protein ES675_04930 [Bizionia algoritergicola]
MFKKLLLILFISSIFISCKKETDTKPAFVKLEYNTSEEDFLKSITIGDNAEVFMKAKTNKFLNNTTMVNTLALRIYFDENENLSEVLLDSEFQNLKSQVQSGILNYDAYDLFLLEFYKDKTLFAKKEEAFK